jgi:beta-glucanase (GH16 family)
LQAAIRLCHKYVLPALGTAATIAVATVLILSGLGIRVPLFELSTITSAFAQPSVVKPHVIAKTAVETCLPAQTQSNAIFAKCPSFSANFTGTPNGPISINLFNIYSGAPIANNEAEYYTDNTANVRVQNGGLVLEARNQSTQGYDFTSARIDTNGKEDFLYGKLVVRAMLPDSVGTWPAIWLLPSQPKYASLSPANDPTAYRNDGEIDIAEEVGTQPNTVYGVAHSLDDPLSGTDRTYFNTVNVPGNNSAYHNYELDWTPTSLTYSVDGQPFFTYTKKSDATWQSWPYDQPFYLVLNLALGGSWGGTDIAQYPGNGVDSSALPASLKIQSIHYYLYVGAR